jgi:hypothetical protein
MNAQPAEHCGNISPGPLGYRSECVLRPGHSGSHANETGGRWWKTTADSPIRDAEAAIARVQAAADQLRRAVVNADGVPLTAYDRGVDTAVRRILAALDEPTDDDGPSVREAAADDRRWWGGEKVGD